MQRSELSVCALCFLLWAVLSSCAANTCAGVPHEDLRPAEWARPMALPGAPNLHKIDDSLYRSAQPTAEGMQGLKELGIRTIVDLRTCHSDLEEIGNTGLGYVNIPMTAFHPTEEEAVAFLKVATDPERAPVLVHCKYGADRTGVMAAVYRVAVQNWTKEDAVLEMTEGCYGFHAVYFNLSPWVMGLDIEKIRKEAGITPAGPKARAPVERQGLVPRYRPAGSSS